MNTRETLVFKTLAWKQTLNGSGNGDLVDHLLEQNPERVISYFQDRRVKYAA
jgi:hypothetical protein